MKKMRKNNKGFSLVELIVVVLIMAIIAVALAPQIMKWVGHSRTSTDAQTYDTLVENVQLALADENVLAQVKGLADGEKVELTISSGGTKLKIAGTEVAAGATGNKLNDKLAEVCGADWRTKVKKKDSAASDYVITIDKTATITRTTAPNSDGVK